MALVRNLFDPYTSAPGFRAPVTILGAPSLYWTSWNVQLRSKIGGQIKGAQRRSVIEWLQRYLDDAAAVPGEGLDRVEQLNLAVQALRALNPKYKLRTDPFESLRVGDEYSTNMAEPPTAAATATAVEGLVAGHSTVPENVVTRLVADSRGSLGDDPLQVLSDTDIPLLTALAEVDPELVPAVVRESISTWRKVVMSSGAGPVQVGLLADLKVASQRLGMAWVKMPASYGRSLRGAKSAYYSLSAGADPDAQVTTKATFIGLTLNKSNALRSSQLGLGPNGWMQLGPVSLIATLEASVILKTCGAKLPDLAAEARGAIQAVAASDLTPSGYSPESNLQAIDLAAIYGVRLAGTDRKRIVSASTSAAIAAATLGDTLTSTIALLAGGDEAASAVAALVSAGPVPSNARSSAAVCIVANFAGSHSLLSRSATAMSTLSVGSSYRLDANQAYPDIYSTALAANCGLVPPRLATTSLRPFTKSRYFSSEPGDASSAQTSLETAFVGSSVYANPHYIFAIL